MEKEVKGIITNEVNFECGAANERFEFFAAFLALIKQIDNNVKNDE